MRPFPPTARTRPALSRGLAAIGILLLLGGAAGAADEWAYLDNGTIRLGVKTSSGGCIAYLSPSGSDRNLLNHFDRGRLVQQSYYGDPDGSVWVKQPWRWNPVQGGDYKGTASTLLELKAEPTQLFARTRPRNWAGCNDLPEVIMEHRITLDANVAHVRFKMTYSGTMRHGEADQEIPAIFVEPDLETLVLYEGDKPWSGGPVTRSRPGWPNESRSMTEHWAAYVDKNDFGVGAFIPVADTLTCYRYAAGHSSKEGACSYFAPLTRFAVTPGFTFEYDLFLTVGHSDEIRTTFRKVHESPAASKAGP